METNPAQDEEKGGKPKLCRTELIELWGPPTPHKIFDLEVLGINYIWNIKQILKEVENAQTPKEFVL